VADNRHHVNVRIDRRLPSTDMMPVGDSGQCLEGRRAKGAGPCVEVDGGLVDWLPVP
jgi:hypothetical protein